MGLANVTVLAERDDNAAGDAADDAAAGSDRGDGDGIFGWPGFTMGALPMVLAMVMEKNKARKNRIMMTLRITSSDIHVNACGVLGGVN